MVASVLVIVPLRWKDYFIECYEFKICNFDLSLSRISAGKQEIGEEQKTCQLIHDIAIPDHPKCYILKVRIRAAPQPKRLVAGFPPRRPGFAPGSAQVWFVVDKVALGQVFSEYFGFPCQSSFHQILHHHKHPAQVPFSGRRAEWTHLNSTPHYAN
jgi:hypothetical protein